MNVNKKTILRHLSFFNIILLLVKVVLTIVVGWSGREDLNLRPPAPKAGALAKLRYAPLLTDKSDIRLAIIHYFYLNTRKILFTQ